MNAPEQIMDIIEDLLQQPYWVIDFLPFQVPSDSRGQFFNVEQYYLNEARMKSFRQQMTDVLLKLNCYDGFHVVSGKGFHYEHNPSPEKTASLIATPEYSIMILLETEPALITLDRDDLHATIYHPSEKLLSLLKPLASAHGLFVWKPNENGD